MEVVLALILLLVGVFVFKNVLYGTLSGVVLLMVSHLVNYSDVSLIFPFTNSLILSAELGLLIFGSILFYKSLEQVGHFQDFAQNLKANYGPLTILFLLSWFLCSFFEGIAGFGVPTLLIAPLLINLGYRPLTAVVVTLSANTLSVTYGALGTPVKLGLGIVDPSHPLLMKMVSLCILPMLILPFVLVFLCSKTESKPISVVKNLKLILVSAFLFIIPYQFSARFTLEYPSAIAGAIGFLVVIASYAPKHKLKSEVLYWFRFFKPYLVLVVLLTTSKFLIGSTQVSFPSGYKSISIYQPGAILVLASAIWLAWNKKTYLTFQDLLGQSFTRVQNSLLNVFFLVLFAKLIHSPILDFFNEFMNEPNALTYFSSLIGISGSFMTGSLTMSNLIFADSFRDIIQAPQTSLLALSLLHIGGALGNAISLQNIVMANSILHPPESVGKIIKFNLFTVAAITTLLMIQLCFLMWY